jgi:uncharacterized protein (TIGR03067 family)
MLSLCLTAAVRADDAKKEIDRLQGEWEVERIEAAGKPVPIAQAEKQFTLKGDELIPGKNMNDPGKLELTPGKTPAWIDLTDRNKKTMQGIYRIDGDHWEICMSDAGSPRPTEFKTTAESKTYLMVLRRKKK